MCVGDEMSSIYNLINTLRTEKEFTQKELGKAVGVSAATVNAWECNHAIPTPPKAKKLAEALGVDIDVIEGVISRCTVDGCAIKVEKQGLCKRHYYMEYTCKVRSKITHEMQTAPTMGDRLRLLRMSRALSPDIFALQFGVTVDTLNAWESNYIKPSMYMLMDIAQYFSVGTRFIERGIIDE
jgi:transcriptional regulator with XRE-family HTH domain